ncbi:MAG: NADPH:quinone reductase-like Zn-dependent oxidoreductase [Paracoccaceae bacterium]|jgi:NADPH:quinone reductase-like Zn-dependent oxidoreductase
MKAIQYSRYGGPDVLNIVELPAPVPAPDEAVITVHCASVIPGDWKVRAGHLQEMFPLDLPTIPGRDGAGIVTATGPDCDWAEIGDEVCFVTEHVEPGSYAEMVARSRRMTVPKPPGSTFAEAAAMVHAGVCAWIALIETARIKAGQNVLIHAGAGAIGGMAVQLAKHVGCRVYTTCSAANCGYVSELGADEVIAYDKTDFVDTLSGMDVVLDLVGGDVHEKSCRVLKAGGTLAWLIASPFDDVSAEYGVTCKQVMVHDRHATLECVAEAVRLGTLKPQVSRILPMSDAAEAHRILERGENSRGRIILNIGE